MWPLPAQEATNEGAEKGRKREKEKRRGIMHLDREHSALSTQPHVASAHDIDSGAEAETVHGDYDGLRAGFEGGDAVLEEAHVLFGGREGSSGEDAVKG
jgi:hypothetical protein